MSDHEHDQSESKAHAPPADPTDRRVAAYQARYHALAHENHHLKELVGQLRGLVSKAFEEGFVARVAGEPEPWLADWLMSTTKAELEALAPRQVGQSVDAAGND